MAGKRDFVGELKAYVKRSALAAGKETTDLAWGRLSAILTAFEAATKNDDEKLCDELRRHIVVSLVAVIQGSARRTIAEIVDIKEEREEELPEPQDVRITIGMIRELKKREFSVGELIAHFSSLGGFEQLSSALQRVFGEDLNTIFLNACRAGTIQITGFEIMRKDIANTSAAKETL